MKPALGSHGAACRATWPQIITGICLMIGVIAPALWGGASGRMVLGSLLAGVLLLVVLAKLLALIIGLLRGSRPEPAVCPRIPDADLPRYSVLVPLYREAEVLPHLRTALIGLDYPSDRIEVLLLVEAHDHQTRAALADLVLPGWIHCVVVPAGLPLTKPRACNHGLLSVTGDLVVVFDAEDRPDPDQLRRAAAAFARLPPQVACLQARLNIDNPGTSIWSRGFACEYTLWFDAYLPGLHALGAPIPLGGTSNHFRAAVIHALAWDPWNVAEDCDLGIRLARAGWQTAMLDSTTWEEAPVRCGTWLRQRSRWAKGWVQTFLVHTRHPLTGLRELGWWRWSWMFAVVGGQVLGLLAAPVGVVIAGCWWWQRWALWDPAQPWTVALLVVAMGLVLATPLFVLAHQLALVPRRNWWMLPWTLALPGYWLVMGIAAWRGTLQLVTAPFLWEKTPHGAGTATPVAVSVTEPVAASASAPVPAERLREVRVAGGSGRIARGWRWGLAGGLLMGAVLAASLAWHTVDRSAVWDAIKLARIAVDSQPTITGEFVIEANWTTAGAVEALLDQPLPDNPEGTAVRMTAWLKVVDGEWFQQTRSWIVPPGATRVAMPLDGDWIADDPGIGGWSPQLLMRVRSAGVRMWLEPHAAVPDRRVVQVLASGQRPVVPQVMTAPQQVASARCQEPVEFRVTLARPVADPADPEALQLRGIVHDSSGNEFQVPGFLTRDFRRIVTADGAEHLTPSGPPLWAVRWTPQTPGNYTIEVLCVEPSRPPVRTAAVPFQVIASTLPGLVSIVGKWCRRDNAWFYPQGINLRSPHDDLVTRMGIPQPSPAAGSAAMETAIARLAGSGWNLLRVWLAPSFGALEWDRGWSGQHGLGSYSLAEAWKMDRVLQAARDQRMVVDLALWQHGPFSPVVDTQWENNPYRLANGGPLGDPSAVLTDATAQSHMRRLIQYAAARWGGDPALFAWTLWIEIDGVTQDGLVEWHRTMARHLAAHDHGHHPISTEFRSATGVAAVWALPEIGYTQLGGYNGNELATVCQQRATTLAAFAKPAFIEELGGQSWGSSPELLAHEIHDGPWIGWVLPLAGSPWPWWWNVVLHHDLGRRQRLFATCIAGEDLSQRTWRFTRGRLATDPELEALARLDDAGGYVWIHRPLQLAGNGGDISQRYRQLTTGFAPLADDPGQLFAPRPGRVLRLDVSGLDPDRTWQVEIYDTWVSAPPQIFQLGGTRGMSVPLDALVRDALVKIRQMP